jgi:16S rRNA (adenine1518-N6/adenine1519-N6)-dimethyltransferase
MTMLRESLLTRTKHLLRAHELHARKGLAQHFLVDGGVVKQILAAADLSSEGTVIEVGPGTGVLTEHLVKIARRVIAIELDKHFAEFLKEKYSTIANLTILNEDVLKTTPSQLLPDASEYTVVANLPYYITGAVIRHFLESPLKPRRMVLMVQKEVAKQITAKPGKMSLLSVSVQVYGNPKIVVKVPSRSFYPAPKVDSAILRIDVYKKPEVKVKSIDEFFEVVKAGFSANRKQLANSLSNGLGLPKAEVLPVLDETDINSKRRAETLTMEEWGLLTEALRKSGKLVNS